MTPSDPHAPPPDGTVAASALWLVGDDGANSVGAVGRWEGTGWPMANDLLGRLRAHGLACGVIDFLGTNDNFAYEWPSTGTQPSRPRQGPATSSPPTRPVGRPSWRPSGDRSSGRATA